MLVGDSKIHFRSLVDSGIAWTLKLSRIKPVSFCQGEAERWHFFTDSAFGGEKLNCIVFSGVLVFLHGFSVWKGKTVSLCFGGRSGALVFLHGFSVSGGAGAERGYLFTDLVSGGENCARGERSAGISSRIWYLGGESRAGKQSAGISSRV